MMRNIVRHANAEWRDQRCTCAKILDPKNQAHQLGQFVDKVEWKSKMVGILRRLDKLNENE